MGSCDLSNSKAIDSSVGGLVWVRRRNGSWWPGLIMGLEELSESCLVSPRSGTPVKLLGREDASIDWYNLEKSKRVKPFRCGEYDECIEKAKASAANAGKKAVKYARREDAILQALELEIARQGEDQLGLDCGMDTSGCVHDISIRNSPPMADPGKVGMTDDVSDSGNEDESDSIPELSQSGLSFEENISSSMVRSGKSRRRTPNDSEEDGTEGVKRMRVLKDLEIGGASNRKVQTGGVVEHELVQEESNELCNLNSGNSLTSEQPLNDTKVDAFSFKRKRFLTSNVQEFLKKKSRRRPLTKVLESTTMVSVPVICNELPNSCGSPLRGLSDGKLSGLESNESKKSLSAAMNNNSDSTGVSCENMTPLNASEVSNFNNKVKDNEVSSVSGLAENDTSDHLFDVPFVRDGKNPLGFSPTLLPCSSGRREIGKLGRQSSQTSQAEPLFVSNEINNETGSTTSAAAADPDNNVSETIEKSGSKWRLKGKRNLRHTSKTRKNDSRNYLLNDDESNGFLTGNELLNGFTEVSDQKVGSNIVGPLENNSLSKHSENHPNESDCNKCKSQEELLTRGRKLTKVKQLPDDPMASQRLPHFRQSHFLVHPKYQMSGFSLKKFSSYASLLDVKLEVKASYRPQHVPLVSLMSKLNCKAIVGHPLTVEVLDDGYCDVLLSEFNLDPHRVGSSYLMGKASGKHCAFRPHASLSKSSRTKKSGQLSKKIRKLSSLTGHKHFVDESMPVVEKPKGPVIACIPLKVAFSRINEALSGLARPIHCPSISAIQ